MHLPVEPSKVSGTEHLKIMLYLTDFAQAGSQYISKNVG
jgi:hypothetical protein